MIKTRSSFEQEAHGSHRSPEKQWFWGRIKIFEFRQSIFPISLLSPLGKGYDPSFEQT